MGRKKQLTDEEIGKIKVLKEQNFSNRQIAKYLNRSDFVIRSYLKQPEKYRKNYRGRKKEALSATDKRAILRIASNSRCSAKTIAEQSGVSASVRTVQRFLKKTPTIKRKKLKGKPVLKENHKRKRLEFARHHMTWKEEWKEVIFTDEKKFNLDGADGYCYYYHDLRKEEQFISRRQHGGGSVMLWGSISYKGVVELSVMEGRQDSKKYLDILKNAKLKIRDVMGADNWILQQDNAAIHTAKLIKTWLKEEKITYLDWPALSPDLNIIENVWGWLSRKVYENGRQFSSKNQLLNTIKSEWEKIPQSYIKTLYESMPNRIFDVINKNGSWTKY